MANVTIGDARFDFGRVVGQTFGLIGRNFVLSDGKRLFLGGSAPGGGGDQVAIPRNK